MTRGGRAWRVALVLALVFALGALSGVAGTALVIARALGRVLDGPPDEITDAPVMMLLERRVGLDAQQREQARAILAAHREELRALHRSVGPRVIALRRAEADELRPSLDARQRERLDALVEHITSRTQRWLDGPR